VSRRPIIETPRALGQRSPIGTVKTTATIPRLGRPAGQPLGTLAIVNRFLFSRRVSKPRSPFGRLLEQYGEHPDKKRHPNIPKQSQNGQQVLGSDLNCSESR